MVGEADTPLATVPDVVATPRVAHCLFDAQWHPGCIGLVASKLKDRLHRPVIAFAPSEAGSTVLRGSARSIPGFHVRDALARVDATRPGLIDRFGGHAMAAGLSLPQAHFADFEAAFLEAATAMIAPEALHATIARDGELPADAFHIPTACALRDGGPWGQGFPDPLFAAEFELPSSAETTPK